MKKYVALVIMVVVCAFLFAGCKESEKKEATSVDYSQYEFTNVSWTRETEQCVETIRFGGDGSFTYSCSCGDPVNDADLCEGYTYDDATKVIQLDYLETTDDIILEITLVKCEGQELHLDFDGEVRVFTKN